MIWIRADANTHMGTGHVMRCLSIGTRAERMGHRVCFLAADEETAGFLQSRGVSPGEGRIFSRVLGTDYRSMEQDLPILEGLLKEEPGPILVDSYFATGAYLEALHRMTFTAYLDEDHRFPYPVDLIINYNIFGESMGYGRFRKEQSARCLLGPRYAPLREQFSEVKYRCSGEVKRILLTTGGADQYHLAGQLLEAFLASGAFRDKEFCVVSGAMNRNYDRLKELARKHSGVQLYSNVSQMASLMGGCDLAVTAGGSTIYELCAVGVPFLCFSFVNNQERIVKGFLEKGLTAFGGDYLRQGPAMITALVEAAERLMEDFEGRRSYSEAQRRLVDTGGAARIAEELTACSRHPEGRTTE